MDCLKMVLLKLSAPYLLLRWIRIRLFWKKKCFKINQNSEVIFNKNHDWYYQVQGQLHIANKNVCLFAVWTGTEYPLKVVKVFKDTDRFLEPENVAKIN